MNENKDLIQRMNAIPCEQSNQPNVLWQAMEEILQRLDLDRKQHTLVSLILDRAGVIARRETEMVKAIQAAFREEA